jgi:hypothetical protein
MASAILPPPDGSSRRKSRPAAVAGLGLAATEAPNNSIIVRR